MELTQIRDLTTRLREQINRVVVGQDQAIELLMTALLSQGHVLVEGVPGTAKTLLARTFAASLSLAFGRIQFTPDLMPGDVVGTNLFNFQTNAFVLNRGPIFTELLLADEINRTPPKTQAALLQAMQERVVTIDGTTHPLGPGFMVVATQNPVEQEGTYPLPEAQLDRFLFKVIVGYPSAEEERAMVRRHGHQVAMPAIEELGLVPLADLATIVAARQAVTQIRLADEMVDYIVAIVRATREKPTLLFGASPRSANMLATAARAHAVLAGRDYVIPDDVKVLALPALRHRLVLSPGAEIEGVTVEQVLGQIVEQVAAPR
jgi:MoxR-like ATPase